MTIRSLDNTLKNSLLAYDPFIVVHLVKFEKPQSVAQYGGKIAGLATDFTYLTDSQYDIAYNDGKTDIEGNTLGTQNYIANKLTKLGTINESILAKASSLTMTLDSASLGAAGTISATFSSAEMLTDTDLPALGFQEGDKVLLSGSGNTNAGAYIRLDKFKNAGKTAVFTQISSISANASAQTYSLNLSSEEINTLIVDKASSSYTSYINREVLIYKAHINPSTRQIIGAPFLYFKGITSGAAITEKLDGSEIKWTLSSHWGDFIRVQGRLTEDSTHRALQADGSPDLESVLRPSYATDLGFLHANTAINHIATYNTVEIEYKQVDINGGWFGGKRLREVEVDVPRQTDLQFNLQAKMLPVIYGVRKVDSFPIFVDTNKASSAEVYRADAICEGPIAGILDIHIDDQSTICMDGVDFDVRNSAGANYDESVVEVVCYGRQDRGDTMSHYAANTGTKQNWTAADNDTDGEYRFRNMGPYFNINYQASQTGATDPAVGAATGMLHEGTHSITSPLNADFTFHVGKADQAANNTLVSLAADEGFKIQNDYYTGKDMYWGPSHQLLDTAYVVGKYTIAEGETSLPELKFVIRGRNPECYNYDGSYKADNSPTLTNAAVGAFLLGDSVTVHATVGGAQIGTTTTIIDKWSSFDIDGESDHRFRLEDTPVLGNTTAFYIKKGTDKWHMQTWDHSEHTSRPASNLYQAAAFSAGSTTGSKATFTSPLAPMAYALAHPDAILGTYKSTDATFNASSYRDFNGAWFGGEFRTDNITGFIATTNVTRIYVKNAINLGSAASSSDNYYNGNEITLTDNLGTAPYVQTRTIIDYDGTTKVAIVDSAWDYAHMAKTSDTYSVGSIGDRRVTINPAMQLLDYMTNARYGKGLDIIEDIDLEAFKIAAVKCDTRSDITVVIPAAQTLPAIGETFKYPASGVLQFKGTVSNIETVGSYKQITFNNCIGKLGIKWNSWQTFASGQLYWNDGKVYLGTGAVVATAPTTGHQTTLSLTKVSGGSIALDIALSSANGNPIVKKSSNSIDFQASGYGLYDADDVKYWRYVGWDDNAQRNVTRHQMNQVVNTTLPIFDNINKMLNQFNGILRYSVGKYALDIKGKKAVSVLAEQISEEDIIGTIKLSDKGLKNSKNFVSTSIIDPNNKFEGRSVSFFNSVYLKEDKGIQKKGQFSLPGITNYYNARFNIKQYLDESRYGLELQFTMAPRGLLLLAGNIIEFTYPRFGYASKAFRITNLNFKKDGLVDVTADEHNDGAYIVEAVGNGLGVVESPESGTGGNTSLPISLRPSGLIATQTNQGEVVLTWTNTSKFSTATHHVEIYRNTTNNFADGGTALIGTSSTDVYNDPISLGQGLQTRYYWIRYIVKTKSFLAGSEYRNVPSLYYPNTSDSGFTNGEGITGIGLATNAVRSVKINPGSTQTFVYQNDGTGIETGYQTSTTLSTVTTNDAGNVTYVWKKTSKTGTVSVISGATSASYVYSPTSSFTDMPETISVFITDTIGSETFTATDSQAFSATRIVVNGSAGLDGYTINASNGNHSFSAPVTGSVGSTASYSSFFTVYKGGQVYTYDGTAAYVANSYRFGTIGSVNPSASVTPVNTNGTITIANNGSGLLTGTSVLQSTFTVPVIDNADGNTIAVFMFSLNKVLGGSVGVNGVRGGSVFTFEEATAGNINATSALAWSGTATNTAVQNVAAQVIANSSDGFIRPNDRITVTDNSADKAGTRVYNGSATQSHASVGTGDFSSLVVETFDGSVIVNGTLSADKLTSNATFSNNLTVGSTMVLNNSGKFYTTNKTSYTDTDNGFFLGYTGGAHKLNIGGATNYLKWDGANLVVAGQINMVGSSTVNGVIASTVTAGAAAGATANQSSNATIQAGTTAANVGLGNVDNTSDATVVTAARAATTATDVGLGNATNASAATIQAGTTASNVGLGNVPNYTAAVMRAGTTAANVGLGNVTDGADITGSNTANNTNNVGGVASSTVNTYGTTAGVSSGSSRAYMNNNGLVVLSGNVKRVKIGNLSAL